MSTVIMVLIEIAVDVLQNNEKCYENKEQR